jgi:hypothetical protein
MESRVRTARLLVPALLVLLGLSACAVSESGKIEEQIRESQEHAPIAAGESVEAVSCEEYDASGLPDGLPTPYDCDIEFSPGNRGTWCAGLAQGILTIFDRQRCAARNFAGYE